MGSRIEEAQWQATWVDKELYNDDGSRKIAVVKSGTARESQIDGISGATLTIRGVNNLLQYWIGEDGYKPFFGQPKGWSSRQG